jgi:hypothetical protein
MKRSHKVSIYRQTGETTGTGGSRTPTYTRIARDQPCILQPKAGGLRQMAYGKDNAVLWLGLFPDDTDIQTNDEIIVTENGAGQFTAVFVGPWSAGWDIEVDLSYSLKAVA